MILINNGTNPFAHKGFVLAKGVKTEVPEAIAKELLKIPGVEKYIAPAELEKAAKEAEEKAVAKIKALEAENEELKAKIAELEKAAKEAKTKTTVKK